MDAFGSLDEIERVVVVANLADAGGGSTGGEGSEHEE